MDANKEAKSVTKMMQKRMKFLTCRLHHFLHRKKWENVKKITLVLDAKKDANTLFGSSAFCYPIHQKMSTPFVISFRSDLI